MILETIAQIVQVVSFILVGLSILILISTVHRVYRSIYGRVNGLDNAPTIGIIKLPRDIIMFSLFGFFGSLGLLVTNSLMGYNVFTEKSKIGYVEYLGKSPTNPDLIRIRFQKTDEDGNSIGTPVELETGGDSIKLWFTLVTVKPSFLQLGKKQVYKIDYLGGDYWRPLTDQNLNWVSIEGGRQDKFQEMVNPENRPFPYSLWVDTVQFYSAQYKITDFNKKIRCDVVLAHNAIQIINPEFSKLDEEGLILKELGIKIRNIEKKSNNYGVEVIDVIANSVCADADMKVGDIILSINDMRIENIENLQFNLQTINESMGELVKFRIKRNDDEMNIKVNIPSRSRITIESETD